MGCAVFLLLLFVQSIVGDYTIGHYYIEEMDPNQFDHAVRGSVHYPENPNPGDTFPVVVVSPGFFFSDSFYDFIWNMFVPKGYIVIVEGSYDYDPFSTPLLKAHDMAFLLDFVNYSSKYDPKSPVYGIVGKTAMSMGHSEGGQASILTADRKSLNYLYNATYSATVVLSGCFGWPDVDVVKEALKDLKTPIMWITGTDDCICTPNFQLGEYNLVSSSCKYFTNLVNGSHCLFANADPLDTVLCFALEAIQGCGLTPRMDAKLQQQLVLRYSFPFADWQLKGMTPAQTQLNNYLAADAKNNLVMYQNTPCS